MSDKLVIDINVRVRELPNIDPILPRWQRCWTLVFGRCGDFDSIACVSVAHLLYEKDGVITADDVAEMWLPTEKICGLAFIQRSL